MTRQASRYSDLSYRCLFIYWHNTFKTFYVQIAQVWHSIALHSNRFYWFGKYNRIEHTAVYATFKLFLFHFLILLQLVTYNIFESGPEQTSISYVVNQSAAILTVRHCAFETMRFCFGLRFAQSRKESSADIKGYRWMYHIKYWRQFFYGCLRNSLFTRPVVPASRARVYF